LLDRVTVDVSNALVSRSACGGRGVGPIMVEAIDSQAPTGASSLRVTSEESGGAGAEIEPEDGAPSGGRTLTTVPEPAESPSRRRRGGRAETDSQDDTQEAEEQSEQSPKQRELPPYRVILHNDDVNTMAYVVVTICALTPLKQRVAISCMLMAHRRGQALLLTTHKERAELYRDQFRSKGLTVTIEPGSQGEGGDDDDDDDDEDLEDEDYDKRDDEDTQDDEHPGDDDPGHRDAGEAREGENAEGKRDERHRGGDSN